MIDQVSADEVKPLTEDKDICNGLDLSPAYLKQLLPSTCCTSLLNFARSLRSS